MDSKIRIMVADPQELFRKSLSLLLKIQDDFNVCGEAATGRELIDKVKVGSYHVIVLDVSMALIDGRSVLNILHSRFTEIKLVSLSMEYEVSLMSEFMANGAACYLSKSCDVKTLLTALRTVHREGHYFDIGISR